MGCKYLTSSMGHPISCQMWSAHRRTRFEGRFINHCRRPRQCQLVQSDDAQKEKRRAGHGEKKWSDRKSENEMHWVLNDRVVKIRKKIIFWVFALRKSEHQKKWQSCEKKGMLWFGLSHSCPRGTNHPNFKNFDGRRPNLSAVQC